MYVEVVDVEDSLPREAPDHLHQKGGKTINLIHRIPEVQGIRGASQDLEYEPLAAGEFMDCLSKSCLIVESLEFDIEEKTRRTPDLRHSAAFWYKIKRCARLSNLKIGARKFSMQVLRCRRKVDCPFKLKLLMEKSTEEIKFRVWDDSDPRRSSTTNYLEYLDQLPNYEQWRHAKILDIENPLLESFAPEFTSFELVRRWSLKDHNEQEMRKFFKASEKWKRCVITSNKTVHFNDFTSDVYSEVDNGKMVAVDVTNGRRRFKIIIEKSGITYEVAKRSQKGL
ncbi:hypothetical protein CAEBREN_15808 [Caenorhabditis brenneri]|uniref:Uncharacterized protein n=1 Tax=Caenorhabditis brenneri TaxID=135651 RepID=G0N6X1_CAEBE|nr:hypothetical protein CAEBREN_15808 [Caenorhabditis brenneri]